MRILVVGDYSRSRREERAGIKYAAYVESPRRMALHYQAADVYVHPTLGDTFPNAILEALACGTPVVATAIGGIPEQVRSLDHQSIPHDIEGFSDDAATGMLVPPKDPIALAGAVMRLLGDSALRSKLSRSAARDAVTRFDVQRQIDQYLAWYAEVLAADVL